MLGTALAIKMAAYVGVAPLAAALAERLPRRAWLVGAASAAGHGLVIDAEHRRWPA